MTDQKLIDDVLAAFADREITAPSRDDIARVLEVFETSLRLCGCDACTTARRERIGLTDHDLTSLARVLHEVVYSPGASFDRAVPGIQEHMRACAEKVAAALPWVVPTPEVELVVGEAHIPTDGEREAMQSALLETGLLRYPGDRYTLADAALAALRRSEVPEPSAGAARPGFFPNGQCRHYQLADGWAKIWCIRTEDGHTEHETAGGVRWTPDAGAEPQGEPSDARDLVIHAERVGAERDDPLILELAEALRAALRAASEVGGEHNV